MKLTQGLAALSLMALGAAAHAEVTGTVTVVSDYDFRGITQSAQDPALQGSIDYANDSGFYIGVWGSNIDFGDEFDADVEVDVYAGFRGGEEVTWDVGAIYYGYPGESDADFQEVYVSLGYNFLSGKVWYSPEFGGFDNDSAFYYELNANYAPADKWGLSAHIGKSDGDYWGDDDYFDWNVGVSYALGHFTLGLKYIDGSDLEIADGTPDDIASSEARAVLSVSTTFPWGD
jgi:uncharacterized protein (TIGR02001 family)